MGVGEVNTGNWTIAGVSYPRDALKSPDGGLFSRKFSLHRVELAFTPKYDGNGGLIVLTPVYVLMNAVQTAALSGTVVAIEVRLLDLTSISSSHMEGAIPWWRARLGTVIG